MSEFTGERVIPGQVNDDLWAEHIARYAFAARLSDEARVLDIGCGAGYGTAELAQRALSATGVDISSDAIVYAAEHYPIPNARFLAASATAIPFPSASFDLITAFEVIEHLDNWHELLMEARRVLHPNGMFLVSTPNKLYYAESRGEGRAESVSQPRIRVHGISGRAGRSISEGNDSAAEPPANRRRFIRTRRLRRWTPKLDTLQRLARRSAFFPRALFHRLRCRRPDPLYMSHAPQTCCANASSTCSFCRSELKKTKAWLEGVMSDRQMLIDHRTN